MKTLLLQRAWKSACLATFYLFALAAIAAGRSTNDNSAALSSEERGAQTTTTEMRDVISDSRLRLGVNSLWFTTGGLLLGITILYGVYWKSNPKPCYGDFFAQGQLVQLVVIITIAGNVCSMGIMGILKQEHIATIYAGIVGYILGKGALPKSEVDKLDTEKPPSDKKQPEPPP